MAAKFRRFMVTELLLHRLHSSWAGAFHHLKEGRKEGKKTRREAKEERRRKEGRWREEGEKEGGGSKVEEAREAKEGRKE
jgi:hypothetical protein